MDITEEDARYVESKLDTFQKTTLQEFNKYINDKTKKYGNKSTFVG